MSAPLSPARAPFPAPPLAEPEPPLQGGEAPGRAPADPAVRPAERVLLGPLAPPDWDALEPRGFYARRLRGPLLYALSLLLVVPALALAVPIALVNACVLGSPRMVFFTQERVGRRGRVFVMCKFRTMRGVPDGASDGLRVTGFGRLLRNSHLDELPQLWNVLRGEMSLIGPRPEMVAIEDWAQRQVPGFAERLVLAPGITGWAQVTQGYTRDRDEEAYLEKLALNQAYLRELSFGRDAAIVLRTAVWMLRRRGWRWNRAGAQQADRAAA